MYKFLFLFTERNIILRRVRRQQRMFDKFCFWVARKLPDNIVYWCAIRVIAYATSGIWYKTDACELRAMTSLTRWEEKMVRKK
jgi:hypothetical protein